MPGSAEVWRCPVFRGILRQGAKFSDGRVVEENTFESKPGREVHYYSEDDLVSEFQGMEILATGMIEDPEEHGEEGRHTHQSGTSMPGKPGRGSGRRPERPAAPGRPEIFRPGPDRDQKFSTDPPSPARNFSTDPWHNGPDYHAGERRLL